MFIKKYFEIFRKSLISDESLIETTPNVKASRWDRKKMKQKLPTRSQSLKGYGRKAQIIPGKTPD